MRLILALSLVSVASAAPTSLTEWGSALSRWSSWFEGASPVPQNVFTVETDTRNIYEMLKGSSEFTRLIKMVDKHQEIVDLLRTNDKRITFFAPNNDALPSHDESLEAMFDQRSSGGGDEDKDRKRRFDEIAREILRYHIMPQEFDSNDIVKNSTLPTELIAEDGSFGGRRRRVKIESQLLPPTTTLNNYVKLGAQYKAKNGIVHVIDHPLIPPPDIMDAIMLFPKYFSTSATALLKTNLQGEFEFNSRHSSNNKHPNQGPFNDHHGHDGGRPGFAATTIFVPNNDAWNKLPNDLVAYLFSPYGENALRKLMQFHTIPDWVVYTEWVRYIKTNEKNQDNKRGIVKGSLFGDDKYEFKFEQDMTTLTKQKLPVFIEKTKSSLPGVSSYNYNFKAHGIDVDNKDNVAQNGAIQIVGRVLCPRHTKASDASSDENDWNEWKDWMFDWVKNN